MRVVEDTWERGYENLINRKMIPNIIFPLSQSETRGLSSQPTRSLVIFLAPRNLLVSWPSLHVTPITTKYICSKKTIIRNISLPWIIQSLHNLHSPLLQHYLFLLFIKFLYPLFQIFSTTLIISHQPPSFRLFGKR